MPQRLIQTHSDKVTTFGPTVADEASADQPLTAEGGPLDLTPTPTAVAGATITAPALPASRSYVITYSAELDNAEAPTTVTARIFDGAPGAGIVVFHQALAASDAQVISWTVKVAGNGLARTFGLSLADPNSTASVPAAGCVGVVALW
jgi:hypothetical protein